MIVALVARNLKYPVKGFDIPVDHYALYNVATDEVIHNSPDNPGVKAVSGSSFWSRYFSKYRDIKHAVDSGVLEVYPAPSEEDSREIWQRAREKIGAAYDKFNYNCEHFARDCCAENPISFQVTKPMFLAGVATGLVGLGAYKIYKWITK